MSSVSIVCNKIDGKDYRISIVPVRKSIAIPNPLSELFPKGTVYENSGEKVGGEPIRFDNIIFEAAIFYKKDFFKPLVAIEFNDTYRDKIKEENFKKLVDQIIANEQVDNLIDSSKVYDLFIKYGYIATSHDMWQLFFFSKAKFIFIFKEPN